MLVGQKGPNLLLNVEFKKYIWNLHSMAQTITNLLNYLI